MKMAIVMMKCKDNENTETKGIYGSLIINNQIVMSLKTELFPEFTVGGSLC